MNLDDFKPCAVYRLFDADGDLLYVGVSNNPEWRFHEHRNRDWWPYVARQRIDWHMTRELASVAEKAALEDEGPLWNGIGNSRRRPVKNRARA